MNQNWTRRDLLVGSVAFRNGFRAEASRSQQSARALGTYEPLLHMLPVYIYIYIYMGCVVSPPTFLLNR